MNDPRIAHTQYNDYKGSAAADSADQKSLTDLAQLIKMPKGFWPVGFSFFVSDGSDVSSPEAIVSVYAVDSTDYGSGIDNINQKVSAKGGTLIVTEFSGRIPLVRLFSFFKRFHVTAFNKVLRAEELDVLDRRSTD